MKSSASATWVLIMTYLTKMHPDPSGERTFFTDNFYMIHSLAGESKLLTDDKTKLIGTVKYMTFYGTSPDDLKNEITGLKDAERDSLNILQVFEKHLNLEELRREHQNGMKKLPKKNRE